MEVRPAVPVKFERNPLQPLTNFWRCRTTILEDGMNLHWMTLTQAQKRALAILAEEGPCPLPAELAEQLINLGLAERSLGTAYCISALGSTVTPTTLH